MSYEKLIERLHQQAVEWTDPDHGPGADAALVTEAANALEEAGRQLDYLAAREGRKDALLEEAGEMLNLCGAKLGMPVEGSHPKSDADSMGVCELLDSIRQALAPAPTSEAEGE